MWHDHTLGSSQREGEPARPARNAWPHAHEELWTDQGNQQNNKSDVFLHTTCLCIRLAGSLKSLLTHSPWFFSDTSLMIRWLSLICYLFFVLLELLFLIFFQDMNEINDQLDKEKIISIDEDLLPRTLFIVNSKRWPHKNSSWQWRAINFRYEEKLLERGITSVVTVEFKWMNDESLSEEFIKVKLGLSIFKILNVCSVFSGFLCPLCAPQSYFWEGNLDFHSWLTVGWLLTTEYAQDDSRHASLRVVTLPSEMPLASFPIPRSQISRPIAAGRLAAQRHPR